MNMSLAPFMTLPKISELPDFGLYMDQVMTLMEKTYPKKPLTKTMINNYTKDRILFPSEKKKYTREHLMLLSLIQVLKRTLSLPEIKVLLSPISADLSKGEKASLYTLYETFYTLFHGALLLAEETKGSLEAQSPHKEVRILLHALLSSYFAEETEKLIDTLA